MNRIPRIAATAVCLVIAAVAHAPDASGQRSPDDAYRELSTLLGSGRGREAEPLIRAMIEQLETELDPGHPARAQYRMLLGYALNRQGRHSEAIEPLSEAVAIFEASMGPENPMAMETRYLAATTAREAGQPEQTATLAGPLLETLRDYVASGRAQAARWEEVPYLRSLFPDQPIHYDQARVANVAALLGLALAEIGRPADADPVLEEAAAGLEAAYGRGHPELVRVREAIEATALNRGDALGRRYVGELGHTRRLAFAGNETFSSEVLRRALNKDVAFVLTSHPAAPFAEFLDVISARLRAGYLAAGFPDARIEAVFLPGTDGGTIQVRIDEGPRFRQGAIRVEGGDPQTRETLVASLQQTDPATPTTPLVRRIRKAINDLRSDYFTYTFEAFDLDRYQTLKAFSDVAQGGGRADWAPGAWVRFTDDGEPPLVKRVRYRLAELARPLATFETEYVRNPDGTADLRIRVLDEGPAGVVGTVTVAGNDVNSSDDVQRCAGLTTGQSLRPDVVNQAMLALWHSGRFFPFAVEFSPRGEGQPEIDVLVLVHEIDGVPPLSEPASAGQEAALRCVQHLNEGTLDGDLILEWTRREPAPPGRLLFAWSPRDGLVHEVHGDSAFVKERGVAWGEGDVDWDIVWTPDRLLAGFGSEPVREVDLAHTRTEVSAFLRLLPSLEGNEEKPLNLAAGGGFGARSEEAPPLRLDVLIHPAVVFLKADAFRSEGDALVVQLKNGDEVWLDPETGQPGTDSRSVLRAEPGFVRASVERIRAEAKRHQPGLVAGGWGPMVTAALRYLGKRAEQGIPDTDRASLTAAIEVVEALIERPDSFASLRAYLAGRGGDNGDNEPEFSIPYDRTAATVAGLMPMLTGMGVWAMAQDLLPPDTWISALGRELLSALSGRTSHSTETMNRLLDDPTIGPFGCLLCAQFVSRFNEPLARRFLSKGLDQATAAGFRQDWELLVNSPKVMSGTVEETLDALAALRPEEVDKLVAILDEEPGGQVREVLDRVRSRPVGQSLADWIAPAMDHFWTESVEERFRTSVHAALHPPVDTAAVAAVVNGEEVPRRWVRVQFEDPGPQAVVLSELPPRPAWGASPGLARAIWTVLIRQGMAARGVSINPARLEESLDTWFPDLVGESDEPWMARVGLSRSEYAAWAVYRETVAAAWQVIAADVPAPDEDAVRQWYVEQGAHWGEKPTLTVVAVQPSNPHSPLELARCARLAADMARWLGKEPASGLLTAALHVDPALRCQINRQDRYRRSDLNEALRNALNRIAPGDCTPPIVLGSALVSAAWIGSQPGDPPAFDDVRATATAALHQQRVAIAFRQWLEPLAETAQVRILEPPESMAASPDADSAFAELQRLDPDSLVAALGLAYEAGRLHIGEESLAVDCVLDANVLDAAGLVRLCAGLVEEGDAAGTRQCLDRARELDPVAAAATLEEQIARHAAHNQCVAGRTLIAMRVADGEAREPVAPAAMEDAP